MKKFFFLIELILLGKENNVQSISDNKQMLISVSIRTYH